jgi:hypothetical protein
MPSSLSNSYGIYGAFLSMCAYNFPRHVNAFGNVEVSNITKREEDTGAVVRCVHFSMAIVLKLLLVAPSI